ncbi:alpha/beta fold hydrolase [Couchioplanes azureus]|uniref:alpha/beta fold hydrolase n=1 Tax=Couchioplanes caeruleus TaxID=56438 RepID=UPI00166FDF11|nr:alpha/beta fold hydrolase [Couchioplanes caeruleus]GGQ51034.1 hypothetical protein GCM10010166_19670 [Couchioplanes caeruleus subsp. azureus]
MTSARGLTPVLIPSVYLGPAAWQPVAEAMRRLGLTAVVPTPPVPAVADPAAVLTTLRDQLTERDDLVLVPHSNAGLYAPGLVAALPVRAVVFVDAVLPPPAGDLPAAPPGMRDLLRERVDAEGLLPPWTEWWPEEDIARLFPDAATRRRVAAEQQRIPFGYLSARVEVPAGWDHVPAAYLAFGDGYAEELADARGRGWPAHVMPGGHLHMLCDPDAVAAEIVRLARTSLPA